MIRLCPHNQCYTRNSLLSQKSCVIFPLAPEIMYNILLNIFDHLLFPEKISKCCDHTVLFRSCKCLGIS